MNCLERNHSTTIETVDLDLAKDVFQVHGVSATCRKIFNRKIRRAKLLAFLRACRHAWSALKHAVQPIIGVAAFAYAVFHTVLYIIDMGSLRAILGEALALGIWTGWLAFFIFVPLAATSNDWSVQRMGPAWKTLQRWVYLAALGTLLHWIFVHNNIGPAFVHFLPLAGLEAYRIWFNSRRRNQHV